MTEISCDVFSSLNRRIRVCSADLVVNCQNESVSSEAQPASGRTLLYICGNGWVEVENSGLVPFVFLFIFYFFFGSLVYGKIRSSDSVRESLDSIQINSIRFKPGTEQALNPAESGMVFVPYLFSDDDNDNNNNEEEAGR